MRFYQGLSRTIVILAMTGLAFADEGGVKTKTDLEATHKQDKDNSGRKSYEALYSEIIGNLPVPVKAMSDSTHLGKPGEKAKPGEKSLMSDEAKKLIEEKRHHETDELPPAVKARVDKVLSDLDTRRKEKAQEFKELNP